MVHHAIAEASTGDYHLFAGTGAMGAHSRAVWTCTYRVTRHTVLLPLLPDVFG